MDLATVAGSGPLGRIVAADVEAAAGKTPSVAPTPTPAPVAVSAPAPAVSAPSASAPAAPAPAIVPGTTVPFTGMQMAVTKNMNASLAVPTFHVGYTITTDALDALYKKVRVLR